MFLPPSPALSLCDSLAGIDDLDAFLESQGALSRFPTPPLINPAATTSTVAARALECESDDANDDTSVIELDPITEEPHLSTLLLHEASRFFTTSLYDQTMTSQFLQRAQLPTEVLAIAFNILHALPPTSSFCQRSSHAQPTIASAPLLVIATLALALAHTSDHPPQNSWWSRHVCQCAWSARLVDRATMSVLGALQWDVLGLISPDSVARALAFFKYSSAAGPAGHEQEMHLQRDTNNSLEKPSASLRLNIDDATLQYASPPAHGLLTPVTPSPNSTRVLFSYV